MLQKFGIRFMTLATVIVSIISASTISGIIRIILDRGNFFFGMTVATASAIIIATPVSNSFFRVMKKLNENRSELSAALDDIKELKGLLPICANCKKIKDSQGYWNHVESYIEKHTNALFTHSICQECAEELYSDTKWYKKMKSKES